MINEQTSSNASYLKYNKHRKIEICYIFRLRAFADESHETLFIRFMP